MKVSLYSKGWKEIVHSVDAYAGDKITQATVINWRGRQFVYRTYRDYELSFVEITRDDVFQLTESDDYPELKKPNWPPGLGGPIPSSDELRAHRAEFRSPEERAYDGFEEDRKRRKR